jgi:hypothetical protein
MINTLKADSTQIVKYLREALILDKSHYKDIDNDLLLLALTPKCDENDETFNKFGTCDHQTLEYYGDRIFYAIAVDIVYSILALTTTPNTLTKLVQMMTSNWLFTDFMFDAGINDLIRVDSYKIKGSHNVCADTFEALLGSMFIYDQDVQDNYVLNIKTWLLKYTKYPHYLRYIFDSLNLFDAPVFVINDKEEILNKYNKKYDTKINLEHIPDNAVIVHYNDDMNHIFKVLNWINYEPVFNKGLYMIYDDNGHMFATGIDRSMVLINTKELFIDMGYIVFSKMVYGKYFKPDKYKGPKYEFKDLGYEEYEFDLF